MADFVQVDSGQTLSVFQKPGEDIRISTSNSESIFTFGSFRFEKNTDTNSLSADTRALSFDSYGTLDNLNAGDGLEEISFNVDNRDLNLKKTDPLSYAYFSSFYTNVAESINNINKDYPYAILAYKNGLSYTILDYENILISSNNYNSSFKIPYSVVKNQGGVLVNSGFSDKPTLFNDTEKFSIQLSGSSDNEEHEIVSYEFIPSSGNNTSFMKFVISGRLFKESTTSGETYTNPVYIRPTKKRLNNYLSSLSRLQKQILIEGEFLIPSAEEPDTDVLRDFIWPKNIDGFNPDNKGESFNDFVKEILTASELVDDSKTSIMIRTMIPENFLEQDNEDLDYSKLIETYSVEFDKIKQFIDTISFAHTVEYKEEESVPKKFMVQLSNLLGWELSSSFNEKDLFEYIVGDVENNKSLSSVNTEIWKRILVNIIWLFKKKGTRDALQFIFKLIGAPECLINLNEFVYDIKESFVKENPIKNSSFSPSQGQNNLVTIPDTLSQGGPSKINENGYINYDYSQFIFQEGGQGRGDGQNYINQWRPEFDPVKRVDNVKVQVGTEEFYGTENIVNTKEVTISISPADAIECDLLNWLKSTDVCWYWGTIDKDPLGRTELDPDKFAFSALTVPFEYLPKDCSYICKECIEDMDFAEFSEWIYANSIDPRTRKTIDQNHTSFWYQELKNVYLLYYYANNPRSNRLTFRSLEFFIDLMEVQFADYFFQLIPATTIFQGTGIEYRNTLFNRQKFVYKEGINDGSEFQTEFTPPLESEITPIIPKSEVPSSNKAPLNIINVSGRLNANVGMKLNPILAVSSIPKNIKMELNPISLKSGVERNVSSEYYSLEPFDFVVAKYKWNPSNGQDLDTRSGLSMSSEPSLNENYIGWSRGNTIPSSPSRWVGGTQEKPFLLWGGDVIVSEGGFESVLIDFKTISENIMDPKFFIQLRAFWYNGIEDGNVEISLQTYLGGEMIPGGFQNKDFVNVGGVEIGSDSIISNITDTNNSADNNGQEAGLIEYDRATKTGKLT